MRIMDKNHLLLRWIAFMVLIVPIFAVSSQAADLMLLPDGSRLDLSQNCPVCGMVVGGKDGQGVTATFKDGRVVGFAGVAAAVFKDGHVAGFEGARCLFIYNSVPQKYGLDPADISRQFVTDFTTKKMIELPKAFLVLGSNVKGPMGYDLIAFADKEEAAKFARVHEGKWIVQLHEIARQGKEAEPEPKAEAEKQQPQKKDSAAPKKRVTKERDTSQDFPETILFPRSSGHHGHMGH